MKCASPGICKGQIASPLEVCPKLQDAKRRSRIVDGSMRPGTGGVLPPAPKPRAAAPDGAALPPESFPTLDLRQRGRRDAKGTWRPQAMLVGRRSLGTGGRQREAAELSCCSWLSDTFFKIFFNYVFGTESLCSSDS